MKEPGPGGSVQVALAPLFGGAVGLDPDAGMLAEAGREAGRLGAGNVRWVRGRAEELPAGLGEFRMVTVASSYHWMDRERVAATVLRMLEPGGAFVHVSDLEDAPGETAPHLFGERLADFERKLRALLHEAGGRFAEHLPPTELKTWRKPH